MEKRVVDLIRKAQEGSQSAFRRLVAMYDDRVSRVIFAIVQNKEDTEDIYQEVFIKVWKKLHTFEFRCDFYSWLYRITVNTCYNFKTSLKRRPVGDDLEYNEIPDDEHDEIQLGVHKAVRQVIKNLPTRQRTVVVMYYLEGNKVHQIAALLKINEGTIKKYLFRARETLRKELSAYA